MYVGLKFSEQSAENLYVSRIHKTEMNFCNTPVFAGTTSSQVHMLHTVVTEIPLLAKPSQDCPTSLLVVRSHFPRQSPREGACRKTAGGAGRKAEVHVCGREGEVQKDHADRSAADTGLTFPNTGKLQRQF